MIVWKAAEPSQNRGDLRVGGMAQVVECLHCKGEVMSSNPSIVKKKKKKMEREV
jgi:hypothetical protein